jgi:GNAT superfamily N-acetyltransferase
MIRIRPARPEEAGTLSELCFRSKAHWGYDDAFMRAARPELTLTPDDIAASHVFVAERASVLCGFYRIKQQGKIAWLEDLFLDPPAMGLGLGRRLWQHAVGLATHLGCTAVEFESDPFAESFYVKMGAHRVGQRESTVVPGRLLPLMRYDLGTM